MSLTRNGWIQGAIAVLIGAPIGLAGAAWLSGTGRHASEPLAQISDPADARMPYTDAPSLDAPPVIDASASELELLAETPADEADEATTVENIETLQTDILSVVEDLAANRGGLGYDLNSYYVEDLAYGDETLKGKGSPKTMCVGAVAEVMVRAIERWSARNDDPVAFEKLPASVWRRGSVQSLRPWIYVWELEKTIPAYNRKYGSGTHNAIVLFGLGKGVKFEDAQPGDFINFNRTSGGGHAVVFLEFLKKDFESASAFGPDVVGFKYFSSQSSGTPGLSYRYAYFDGYCPDRKAGFLRDCGLLKSDKSSLFSAARLYAPRHWRTQDTRHFIEQLFEQGKTFEEINAVRFEGVPKTLSTRSVVELLPYRKELEEAPAVNFSGATTD